ncbi:MAG: tetratricopeptide repeat protein [Candidatus Moraniibacteriota bacterium]
MLYSIIPPLLLLLSVIGIILFLVKKTPDINRLEKKEENLALSKNKQQDADEKKSKFISKINQVALVVLEKAIRRFRLLFLKLENSFKLLGDSIRRKRNGKTEEKMNAVASEEKERLDGVFEKAEKYAPEKKELRERMFLRRKNYQEESEEKFFRPIVSDRVVVPKRMREVKGRLEELLIERIAINPKDIEAYERLGEYYLEIKNLEHAKECFKQILRLNPLNSNIKYKIRKLERMLRN